MMQVIEKPLDLPGTRTVVLDRWHRCPVTVQVADTDYGGGVYHGTYFALYNQARDVFMEDLGVSYFSLMNQGMNLSVAELHTRYLKPVRYGENIQVLTRISWLRSRSMGVVQKMVSVLPDTEEEILKNQVEMNLVCTDTKIGAVPLPEKLVKAIQTYYGSDGIKTV
ncbi:MAG TPA: hypothetical protein DHV36_01625 [Desulfobacteraceae bacterium]|nr:hypothetical protein [Desulfobacteraceae bacterium]|tara:strand:+ start:1634 stop:2131 length:498 start_codon:yes stop_codon:yes gene_type:complete